MTIKFNLAAVDKPYIKKFIEKIKKPKETVCVLSEYRISVGEECPYEAIKAKIVTTTTKALLLDIQGKTQQWFPKSKIYISDTSEELFLIPQWILKRKNISTKLEDFSENTKTEHEILLEKAKEMKELLDKFP